MASQAKSTHKEVDGREDRRRVSSRSGHEGVQHPIPRPSEHCAVCFLTFGSQERKVFKYDVVAHPRCVRRLRKPDAA